MRGWETEAERETRLDLGPPEAWEDTAPAPWRCECCDAGMDEPDDLCLTCATAGCRGQGYLCRAGAL